eukprot:m.80708 g.80708  ORF g.80708 m.80708 type:complete len:50 (+) comp14559_c0_seq2:1393-1542(+)
MERLGYAACENQQYNDHKYDKLCQELILGASDGRSNGCECGNHATGPEG